MASKDTHDPGWNDPPIFTYDKATEIQTAAANKKGNLLNKRVPFPMSCEIRNDSGQHLPGKPPLVAPRQAPLVPPPMMLPTSSIQTEQKQMLDRQEEVKVIEKEKIDEVLRNLEIHAISDEEILKRVRIMEKMWRDEKLDGCVQLKILELSQALIKGDAEAADHIQKSLMVDKISQCSSWMSGIRHLINQKRLSNS